MLRRSSRKVKARPNNVDILEEGPDDITSDEEFMERPRKRQKQCGALVKEHKIKRVRKRGSLNKLTEIPLDILFEIFGHLNPVDILHLARTTKALRTILMKRSSISVWKQARSNVEGFPNCPSDLSEPQYARLAFDLQCHYCLKANTPTIIWSCRARCCRKCLDTHYADNAITFGLFSGIVPTIAGTATGSIFACRYKMHWKSCLSTVELYRDEYSKLDQAEEEPWLAKKRAHCHAIMEHAKLCVTWHENQTESRSAELDDARRRRYEAIEQRLVALGWGDEFKNGPPREIFQHPLVKQPKDLTDRIWDNIKPTLLEIMERLKKERLADEHRAGLRKILTILLELRREFVASQPLHAIVPYVGDIAIMERFKTIATDTPIETLTKDQFIEAIDELPALIEAWREAKDSELLAMIKQSIEIDGSDSRRILNLASTLFHCNRCSRKIAYPRVLIHSCCMDTYTEPEDELDCKPWTSSNITFDHGSYMSARSVLEACGYDPDITTRQEVISPKFLVECLGHDTNFEGRVIMRFQSAIAHPSGHRKNLADLGDEDMKRIANIEEGRHERFCTLRRYRPIWVCVRCKARLSWSEADEHIRTEHTEVDRIASEPVESEDVVLHLDVVSQAADVIWLPTLTLSD